MIIQTLAELHFLSSSEPRRSFCASLPNCARCNSVSLPHGCGLWPSCRNRANGPAVFLPCKTRPGKIQTRNFMEFHGISWNFITWHETILENAMTSSWSAFISFQSSDLALYENHFPVEIPRIDPRFVGSLKTPSQPPCSNEEKLQILDA